MSDLVRRRQMIDGGDSPEEVKRIERGKLNALLGICETAGCRRQAILAHFGEAHPGHCGNCDTCLQPVDTIDGLEPAQKLLSAVYRTGQRFGAGHVIDVLLGRSTEKVTRERHDALPTFGVGRDRDERFWQSAVRQLAAFGLIVVDHAAYGALTLGDGARAVLRGEQALRLRRDRSLKEAKAASGRDAARVVPAGDDPLFQRLRAERARIAKDQNVPPYVVFHDATLIAMAAARPGSLSAMRSLPGMGQTKLDRYGAEFLAVIEAADEDG